MQKDILQTKPAKFALNPSKQNKTGSRKLVPQEPERGLSDAVAAAGHSINQSSLAESDKSLQST